MTCKELLEWMPELATGELATTPGMDEHLLACAECAGQLAETQKMMALLDEWQAPEPSPYFDTRLQARLREEIARPAGWFAWMRKPALALALTLLVAVGGTFVSRNSLGPNAKNNVSGPGQVAVTAPPGTAVGDLEALERNHELYNDFAILDELQVQSDVAANP